MMSNRQDRGFTLIEVLTVIIIIGVLTGVLLPVLVTARVRGRVAATRAEVAAVATAAEAFKADMSSYPCDEHTAQSCPNHRFLGCIGPDSAFQIKIEGRPASRDQILKHPKNQSTRGLVFFLTTHFWVEGKGYGPYMNLKLDRVWPVEPIEYWYFSGAPSGPGGVRWGFVAIGSVVNSRYRVYVLKDWFENFYVYDSHFMESRLILMTARNDYANAHNAASYDIYSFGPVYSKTSSGTVADYDDTGVDPGEAEDDINNWK